MNTDIFQNSQQELKSYWNRPGGKFGVIAGIALLGVIGYYVLPILTNVVWNTINFTIAVVCFLLLLYAITNRKLRLITETIDLVQMGFSWDKDIKKNKDFQELVIQMKYRM